VRVLQIFARIGLILVAIGHETAIAQTRRALLVGIDEYTRPSPNGVHPPSERTRARLQRIHGTPARKSLMNLDGAVNDASQFRDLLVRRFGFRKENVELLTNGQATADNILSRLQSLLIGSARSGDISLFYYAGHGSRIVNSLTENRSGMDSTIIPADALLGVPDITSKELARIYAQAPAKGIQLTVIQDSCFSGGGARGLWPHKTREQPEDRQVSIADRLEVRPPETDGVLVVSAAQDYQPAQELDDTDLQGPHGAFSWALLHSLASSPQGERADRLFQRTRALMQSKVTDQEPSIVALRGRNQLTLFGEAASESSRASVAVGYVDLAKGMLELNGGLAMNFHEGCELKRIAPAKPPLEALIAEVNGPALSNATIVAPGALKDVHAGDLFRLDKWVAPDRETLRVYLGPALPFRSIAATLPEIAALRSRKDVEFISDATAKTPTHILSWDGHWALRENRPDAEAILIDPFTSDSVIKHLPKAGNKPRLTVVIPGAEELRLHFGESRDRVVAVADSPRQADYVLVGRYRDGGGVEYAWAGPGASEEEIERQTKEAQAAGKLPPMPARPIRTDWFAVDGRAESFRSGSQSLIDSAQQLARVVGWLELRSPSDDPFAYRLALRDSETKSLAGDGELIGMRTYKLALQREAATAQPPVAPRRIYVFVIDCFGKGTLLFPRGNIENELPRPEEASAPLIELTKLPADVRVRAPYGIDNYFLLTTSEPIDDPQTVFNFEGVRTRGAVIVNPLSRLISMRAAGTRGSLSGVPTDWSIERVAFRSVPPDGGK
jgi:hypothetical protein